MFSRFSVVFDSDEKAKKYVYRPRSILSKGWLSLVNSGKSKKNRELKIAAEKAKRGRKNANRYYCAYLAGDGYYWSKFDIKHYPEI